MKKIPLTQGKFALVDDGDFDFLNQFKWHYGARVYAISWIKGKFVYMHRLVNKTPKRFHTDHINRNTLDNRRNNLRIATPSKNALNSKIQSNNSSGHRGISWYKRHKCWSAYISVRSVQRKRIFLGYFSSLKKALDARRNADKLYVKYE